MTLASAYARYSTEWQDANSIEYQMNAIYEYCKKNEIEIVKEYADEALSGTNMNRPGFQQLKRDADNKLFSAVIVYDVTRGSRDVGDWFTFRREMMHLNVEVISTKGQLGDPLDGNAFLLELLSVGMGHNEVLDTRQKSRDGVKAKALHGLFLGGYPPLGYKIVDRKYVIDEGEAPAVRTMFEMYAAGASYADIIEKLDGVRTRKGQPLGKTTIYSVLSNERYTGVHIWNEKIIRVMHKWAGGRPNPDMVRIEGLIPPLVDKSTWEAVRRHMDNNKHRARNKAKRDYLLSGLIECQDCGCSYVGHTSTSKKGYENRYYVCGNKYRTRSCKAKNIQADEAEMFVMMQLGEFIKKTDFGEMAMRIAFRMNQSMQDCEREKEELIEVERKIANGLKAILSGMDLKELRDEVEKLQIRKGELNEIIAANGIGQKIDAKVLAECFRRDAILFEENPKAGVQKFIQKIYAYPDGSFTVEVGVHIVGSPSGDAVICAKFKYERAA